MNRFDKIASGAAIVTTLLCARGMIFLADHYLRHIPATMSMIGVAGWVIATYGPIAIAVWFWRWTQRVRAPWVLHVLLLPCAVALFRTGESLMLFVIGDPDFDATLGGPIFPATLLFVFAVGGYFAALIYRQISAQAIRRRAANQQ